jgi:hypothetical protein
VQAAVPPRTRKELYQGILLAIPFLLAALAVPLYSTGLFKQQNGGAIAYEMAFVIILGIYLMLYLFDLIVLDILMFYTWTPRFLVIPGTEGLPGYKDFRPHLKTHLTTGIGIVVVWAALLALIPTFLY